MAIIHLTISSPIEYQTCADNTLDNLVKKDNDKCVCKTPCEVRRLVFFKIVSTRPATYML